MALKANNRILKCMRASTGSQCNSQSAGVMWEYFSISIINLAAAFCTRCNLAICSLGRPYSHTLAFKDVYLNNNFHV